MFSTNLNLLATPGWPPLLMITQIDMKYKSSDMLQHLSTFVVYIGLIKRHSCAKNWLLIRFSTLETMKSHDIDTILIV